ncbi:MAG TPA: tetratricopeptide repeat protein [Candidatus Acidoferrales bacterium]|nr:tetratricopeptide repeat protein [Candidatus Acidoferrales bacterium]
MKLTGYRLTVVLILSSFCAYAQSTAPHGGPDKLTLLYLLKSGLYEPLMKKLDDVTEILEKDKTLEEYYWRAFSTFEIPDSTIEVSLNDWIRRYPECANAYAARARYYMRVGWRLRGVGWAKDVTEEQWNGMREYFKKAVLDASEGLKIDERNLACYDVFITISMHMGGKLATRNFFDAALKIDPTSLGIWVSYMKSLWPRWGGSHEEMLQLADESQKYLSLNPQLKVLRGYIPFDEGMDLEYEGDYESAIVKYNEAISFGDRAEFYDYRGDCYYSIRKYQQALEDYENAVQLSPQNSTFLRAEAGALYALGNFVQARSIIDYASKISPADENLQQTKSYLNSKSAEAHGHAKKGYDLLQAQRFEEAIQEYTLAIKADPGDYLSFYNRGICYRNLNRYDEAISDFEHTIALNSGYTSAYNNIGWIHYQQGKYEDAVSDNSRAIDSKPDDYNGYINRALCYLHLGRKQDALNDLKHACDLGCEDACDRYNQINGQ